MKDKFDELAKGLAQSTTRRQALKKFSLGLAGMAVACFGLAIPLPASGQTYTTIDYPGADCVAFPSPRPAGPRLG
jgi:hypothetical protein